EVCNLVWRKHRKAAATGHDAGDVIVEVVMGLGAKFIADPNASNGRRPDKAECVFTGKIRQAIGDKRRLEKEGGRIFGAKLAQQTRKRRNKILRAASKDEATKIVSIEEETIQPLSGNYTHPPTAIEAFDI